MKYQWEQVTKPEGYDIFPGMDPAANWFILGPGSSAFFQYVQEEQLQPIEDAGEPKNQKSLFPSRYGNISVPVAFDIPEDAVNDDSVVRFFEALEVDPLRLSSGFFFTTPHMLDNLFNNNGQLLANPEFMRSFANSRASFKLFAPINGNTVKDTIFSDGPQPVTPGEWRNETVIMAVIDDGLGFANNSFRDKKSKSRFQYLWWQDTDATPSAGVPFGVEKGKKEIDDLLEDEPSDADVYRKFGTMDFKRDRRSTVALGLTHGTHVLDIAAGYDPDDDRQDRPIIGVQLWQEAVERGTGAELELYILAAVEYILKRAVQISDSVGEKLPVVINLSFGFNLGPHDGTSLFEKNLSKLIQSHNENEGGASIVISSGNNHLTRTHSEVTFDSRQPVHPSQLEWQVLPEDRTSTAMEIWLPYDSKVEDENTDFLPDQPRFTDDRFQFTLTTPTGLKSEPILCQHGAGARLNTIIGSDSHQIAEIKYCFVSGHTGRGMVRITLTPTAKLAAENGPWANTEVSPSGVWTITLTRRAFNKDEIAQGTVEKIDAWIVSDDQVYGYPLLGQQSYFVNDLYDDYDTQGREIVEDSGGSSPVRRKSLINAAATGENVNVAGSYYERELEQTEYSAGGPKVGAKAETVNPSYNRKPDLLAASEGSRIHYGVLAAGSMSGSVRPMGGTSVAAPMFARRLADELAKPGCTSLAATVNVIEGLDSSSSLTDERGGFGLLKPFHRVKEKRFITDSSA
ncbi:hypothetical protein AB833_04500 [Chromatiales bacterium (ex Bugula neritina AB1)]|nr:hypothetical protein AB833_04500 [Chromatiales bacterium (ex Bugula neritina AB1)]